LNNLANIELQKLFLSKPIFAKSLIWNRNNQKVTESAKLETVFWQRDPEGFIERDNFKQVQKDNGFMITCDLVIGLLMPL
jgi:hypothetical protein